MEVLAQTMEVYTLTATPVEHGITMATIQYAKVKDTCTYNAKSFPYVLYFVIGSA